MTNKKSNKLTSAQKAKVSKLNKEIEDLELHEMTSEQITETVKAFSTEGLALRRVRKKIRYQLYRLKAEAEGTAKGLSTDEFKARFEGKKGFEGWRMFSVTWDVAFDDPYRIVHKTLSEQDEWENVMKSKFPSISHDGVISYPDLEVRKKIEAHLRTKNKK